MGNRSSMRSQSSSTGGGGGGGGGPSAAGTEKKKSARKGQGSGGYLTFDTSSGGILTLHWSHEPISGAMAYFAPGKKVPDFKFTQNAGRVELMRNLGVTKQKYLEGWAAFIREAAAYDGTLHFLDAKDVSLWLLSGNQVKKLSVGSSTNIKSVDAVACMPGGNTTYQGVAKISPSDFINKATREGAKWSRQ